MADKRPIVGLTEKVTVIGKNGKNKTTTARIDTGATKSSIDTELVAELKLGPIIDTTFIKSASGSETRPVIFVEVKIMGKIIKEKFTVAQREHMTYKMLIGQNILKKHKFMVDPTK